MSFFKPVGLPWRTGAISVFVSLSVFAAATYGLDTWPWADQRPLRERYVFERVSRADLAPVLQAPGRLESSKRTMVRCQIENLSGAGSGGATTVLWLVPEGTEVKKGDLLATLDASNYEELVRVQEITVEQAKASQLQAKLNQEIALLAVSQYREGTVQETLESMEGAIALAQSDLSRAQDHLRWTRRMNEKGYSTPAAIATEERGVAQLDFNLKRQLTSLELFRRFTCPKTEKSLLGQVRAADTVLGNESLRLQRQVDRLALLKRQVANCSIRAPHDGVVYYFKDNNRSRDSQAIEEGMSVIQRQTLFYLPDLSELEVQVVLNESVIERVAAGLHATVRFEALPKLSVDGQVVAVGAIPSRPTRDGEDIRYFVGRVKLDRSVPGLKPGMSTRVEIALEQRPHVLAVPHQAVRLDGSRKVCFVARDEELEIRPVQVGGDTSEMIEVTEGLAEGELVALNPPTSLATIRSLLKFDAAPPPTHSAGDTVADTQR